MAVHIMSAETQDADAVAKMVVGELLHEILAVASDKSRCYHADAVGRARSCEVYEHRLKALGKSVDVHWFDAGHLGEGVEQDIQHFEPMLKFVYRVLGVLERSHVSTPTKN
jgi:hypothetical protein